MNPIPEPGTSLDTVQAMRAIAATSVVLAHVPFIGVGVFGVDIFFVISGFIVAYVTAADAGHFLPKRIFRIVPLYWAGTLGVFAIALLLPGLLQSTTADPVNLLKSLLFIPYVRDNGDIAPMLPLGWTLNYEMFFYLLYSLALRIDAQRAPWLAIAAIAAIVAAGQVLEPAHVVPAFFSSPVLLEFTYGLGAYLLWRHHRGYFTRIPPLLSLAVAAVALAAMCAAAPGSAANGVRWLPLGVPALAFFLCVLSMQGKWRMPALLVVTGDASYSLYLFHMYVVQLVHRKLYPLDTLSPAGALVAALVVVLCVFLAWLSFRFFEKPANRWLRSRLPRAR